MRNLLMTLAILATSLCQFISMAQVKRCGTMEVYNTHLGQNPYIAEVKEQMEMAAAEWRKNGLFKSNGSPVLTIPVVFHIIYNADSLQQNIPDSVIFSQIDVLNESFRRLNPDTDDVRPVFDSLAADVGIEFCLATTDPDGNPTTGITRTPTTVASFEFLYNQQDDMKFTATGGHDAWPKDSYLNIWTCYMTIFNSPGVLGYSHFPWDTAASKDGVVLLYNTVGRGSKVFDMDPGEGKTATHEVGHWLGLFHIWGNESFSSSCDSSDYVDDTPNQNGQSNFDCNKTINSCSNEDAFWTGQNPPDMVENYMDYSNDTCMCMYSTAQKGRMLSFLNTSRAGLFTSNGCAGASSVNKKRLAGMNFDFFPNPSAGKITITSSGEDEFNVEVYNLTGQKMLSKKNCLPWQNISIAELPPGSYFFKISSGNSEENFKLIISEH